MVNGFRLLSKKPSTLPVLKGQYQDEEEEEIAIFLKTITVLQLDKICIYIFNKV